MQPGAERPGNMDHLPARTLAAVVTWLQMTDRPKPAPIPAAPFRLVRWQNVEADKYRALFRRIGQPWLWFSRLVIAETDLLKIIHDPAVEIYAMVDRQGIEVGILELDFRKAPDCELGFFGVIPELAGKGHGRWLMAQAQSLAWRKGITRFWVHTCTLDHPGALSFYRKSGFVPFARSIEMFDDPRITGILPRDAAPHVPLLDQPASRS